MTAHSKLGKSGIECFFGNPYPHHTCTPPKSNSLDRKPSKRILKNCDKNAEVYLSTTDIFSCGFRCGRTQPSLRGWLLGVGHAPMSIWTTQLDVIISSSSSFFFYSSSFSSFSPPHPSPVPFPAPPPSFSSPSSLISHRRHKVGGRLGKTGK